MYSLSCPYPIYLFTPYYILSYVFVFLPISLATYWQIFSELYFEGFHFVHKTLLYACYSPVVSEGGPEAIEAARLLSALAAPRSKDKDGIEANVSSACHSH